MYRNDISVVMVVICLEYLPWGEGLPLFWFVSLSYEKTVYGKFELCNLYQISYLTMLKVI